MDSQCPMTPDHFYLTKLIDNNKHQIDTYELFQKTKLFLKSDSSPSQQQNLRKINAILKRKLSQKFNSNIHNFIGLLCIYIYISNQHQTFTFKHKQFSSNFHKALIEAYLNLKKFYHSDQAKPALVSFSTIIFILVTFIQKNEAKEEDHSFIFNDKIMSSFLNFQIPDDEKLLKSYQIIILYLMKSPFIASKDNRKLLYKSVLNHLSSKHLPDSFAFLMMNFIKRHMKYYKTVSVDQPQLILKLKTWLITVTDPKKLLTLLQILVAIPEQSLTIDEYMLLFSRLHSQNKVELADHEDVLIEAAKLVKVDEQSEDQVDKLMVFSFQNNVSKKLALVISNKIISKISFELFLHFLSNEGNCLWQNLKSLILNEKDKSIVEEGIDLLSIILNRLEGENYYYYLCLAEETDELLGSMEEEVVKSHFMKICEIRMMLLNSREKELN